MSESISEPRDETARAARSAFDLRRDGLGLFLFTAGSFFSVLIALALGSDEPLSEARGTGALARAFGGSFGLAPGLLFCAGIAWLGARLYLVGGDRHLRRHAGGLALTAIGLSILLGAFSVTAGGLAGDLTSGTIARFTHPLLGVLFGLAVFLVPVWLIWLRPNLVPLTPEVAVDEHATARHERRERSGPVADEGVSPAEAAALIPEYPPPSSVDTRKQPERALPAVAPALRVSATPLRADVRAPGRADLRAPGESQSGARPLDPTHVHASLPTAPSLVSKPGTGAVPPVRERPPAGEPARPVLAAREDLALAPGPEPVLELPPAIAPQPSGTEALDELRAALAELLADQADRLGSGRDERATPTLSASRLLEHASRATDEDETAESEVVEEESDEESEQGLVGEDAANFDTALEPEVARAADERAASEDEIPVQAPRELPRPSWEQPELFEVAEEPVDAYGTPISTVEAVRAHAVEDWDGDGPASLDHALEEPESAEPVSAEGASPDVEIGVEIRAEIGSEDRIEREIELKPAPRPPTKRAAKREKKPAPERGPADERTELLTEIGCLLVDRGRVAVSMLQKQYGMDFEEATRALDELQSLGLIGPYLGGKHRDILLTRDEWLERVASL